MRLRADARSQIDAFAKKMRAHHSVLNVFFVSGAYDFLIHAAVADPAALRDIIVDDLNSLPIVASTETHLIFEHSRARSRSGAEERATEGTVAALSRAGAAERTTGAGAERCRCDCT